MGTKLKRLLLILMLGIFLTSLTSASLGTFKQDDCISLYQYCDNCSYVNITTIQYPNGTILAINEAMTKNDVDYNYTFCSTNDLGNYYYTVKGDKDGITSTERLDFEVTYSGYDLKTEQGFLYLSLFAILIFFFIITLLGINQLPKSNERDEEGKILSITYLKYLRPVGWMFEYMLIVAILYLSSNLAFTYLREQMFAQILFVLFRLLFIFAPLVVIVWIIWIYRQMFHDKQMQKILNRGFFPQGKL